MQYSQKYCLVAFTEVVPVGTAFNMSEWPLHITLADVFAIERATCQLDIKLDKLLSGISPVPVKATRKSTLGTASVVLLEKTPILLNLHAQIVELLISNKAVFNTPEFTLGGFVPHSSIQKSGMLALGSTQLITHISLIDMYPEQNWQRRKVLHVFALGSNI